jgi:GT2 family glycosyltransferase
LSRPPATPLRLAFAVTETGDDAAAGDLFTAMELGAALARRFGWHIDYLPQGPGWYALAGVDVVVAMVDEFDPRRIHGHHARLVRVAWARNWFERWCDRPWAGSYDLYLASSQRSARYLSERTGSLARLLRIATNPQRFHADSRPAEPPLDYVFTGSYWGVDRDITPALGAMPPALRGAIYGKHWQTHAQLAALDRGFVPYADLPAVYRQAAVVIDDANHVTKAWGAANSRVFDALAAGCLVVTNSESVSDEVFDGQLPVYQSPADLARLVSHYVQDAAARAALVQQLRSQVLARHSYEHRAMEFRLHLDAFLKRERSVAVTDSTALQVSFIVPLFNHLAHTQAMLASLMASLPAGLAYEVVLVDDFSTDGTRDWLATLNDPRIKTLRNPRNLGYARANNRAAAVATGQLLALVNNDLLLEPGWLEPMMHILRSPKLNAGLVGNVQYRVADGQLDHAGVQLNPNAQLGHVQTLPSGAAPHAQVLAVTGACVLLRKADFDAHGGFDEQFVNGGEDIDLCFKLRAAGKHIYVAHTSRIRHHVSLSREPHSLQNDRNSRHLFARWRQVIKQELTGLWATLLQGEPQAYALWLAGQPALADAARAPNAPAVIAQAMLQREEQRWARDLGDLDPYAWTMQ